MVAITHLLRSYGREERFDPQDVLRCWLRYYQKNDCCWCMYEYDPFHNLGVQVFPE